MRRTTLSLLLLSVAGPIAAQDTQIPPPRILRINVATVRPGMAAAHERHEQGWPLAFAEAKVPVHYFGMARATGATEVWYTSGYQSYAEMAKEKEAIAKAPGLQAKLDKLYEKDADYVSSYRTLIAEFQPELSNGDPPDFSRVRGYRVFVNRMQLGHEAEFAELMKLYYAAQKKAGLTPSFGMFFVTEGTAVPTMLMFRPFRSIADYDAFNADGARGMAGMTSEERDRMAKLIQSSVAGFESFTLTVSPAQSSVPMEYAKADPEFWATNPVIAAMNVRKAGVTQAGTPAAKKKP